MNLLERILKLYEIQISPEELNMLFLRNNIFTVNLRQLGNNVGGNIDLGDNLWGWAKQYKTQTRYLINIWCQRRFRTDCLARRGKGKQCRVIREAVGVG